MDSSGDCVSDLCCFIKRAMHAEAMHIKGSRNERFGWAGISRAPILRAVILRATETIRLGRYIKGCVYQGPLLDRLRERRRGRPNRRACAESGSGAARARARARMEIATVGLRMFVPTLFTSTSSSSPNESSASRISLSLRGRPGKDWVGRKGVKGGECG